MPNNWYVHPRTWYSAFLPHCKTTKDKETLHETYVNAMNGIDEHVPMFSLGDTVVFDPDSFNQKYWNRLSDFDKVKYYGCFYDVQHPEKLKLFTYICGHQPQFGHCTLMDLGTGRMYPMCHEGNFRLAKDYEC